MWSGEVRSLGFFAVAAVLPLLSVNGLYCPLPETVEGQEDHVNICAMCSDSAAAVRWRVRRDVSFGTFLARYVCKVNGTVVYQGNSRIRDPCFEPYPDVDESFTGTTGVGYELWTGVQCEFRVAYRTNKSIVETTTCTVKSSETCAESPDECSIDRVSSLNGEGECEFQCTTGYGGQLCNNIDECAGNDTVCDGNADCHDTDGSYWCECRPGFQGDGYNCTDTNECDSHNVTCDENSMCINTEGTYECECNPGYSGDGYSCTDVDECLNVPCSGENSECVNTEGNYSCQCEPGFTGDGYNCTDIDECLDDVCEMNAECVNTNGSFSCQCKPGFTGDGYNCTDIDECLNVPCSGENSECVNTEGNYSCQCEPGFTGDGYNCTDIDECMEGSHTCSDVSYCINLVGSHECKSNGPSMNAAAVVSGVVCVSLLLLMALVTLLLIAINRRLKRDKMPAFHELTKTDLDPYYMPKFWEGSLLSIQSVYEKLVFTESTTDIRNTESREHGSSIHAEDTPVILISDTVDDPTHRPKLHPHPQTNTQRGENDYVSDSSINALSQHHRRLTGPNSIHGFDSRAVSLSVTLGATDREEPSPSTAVISCVKYTFEVPLPGSELLSPGIAATERSSATRPAVGYVQEEEYNGIVCCNKHQVTGRETAKLSDTLQSDGVGAGLAQVKGEETDYEGSTATSGYNTDSVVEMPSETEYPEQFSSEVPIVGGGYGGDYLPSSVGGSSGYVTDSTMAGELVSPTSANTNHSLSNWHSQTSLQSTDTDDTTTDLAESNLDSVKFTVNARQEFEYINAIDETFLSDVKFEIDQ